MFERSRKSSSPPPVTTERAMIRALLIGLALVFMALMLILPVVVVFTEALRKGVSIYFASFSDPDALAAIQLTLIVAAISVPLNTIFGIAASWAIAKFEFNGKSLLITLIGHSLSRPSSQA
jgi:sulfate transport system permease protein